MYGLLGEKLGHSFSPQIHALLGDYEYRLFEKQKNELDDFFKNRNWDGINVTIPYKKAVIPYLDRLSPSAEKIGSVNTIVAEKDGTLTGYNTDYDGFSYLIDVSGISAENKKCLVLGSGGASLTVIAVLKDKKAREIVNISRSGENNYENIDRHFDADIIVNTTPVGMYPNNLKSALSLDGFKNLSGVLDIVYNPQKTKLILDAEKQNIKALSGLSMLVAQGKRAAELFLNTKIPDSKNDDIYHKLSLEMKNIILIGMPGSGKTTVGKRIAEVLNRDFIDTDEMIVKNVGKPIPDIFANGGEKLFRKYEHEAVLAAGKLSGKVISTGGGVVVNDDNFDALKQNGTIIFLNRSTSYLPTDGRPLSQSNDLNEMLKKRLPLYRKFCDIEADGNDTIENVANNVLKELQNENTCN